MRGVGSGSVWYFSTQTAEISDCKVCTRHGNSSGQGLCIGMAIIDCGDETMSSCSLMFPHSRPSSNNPVCVHLPLPFFCLRDLAVSVPYLTLSTSSLPGFASSYIACFVSGPPGPSKSRAFVGLVKSQCCPKPPIHEPADSNLLGRSALLAGLGDQVSALVDGDFSVVTGA